MSARIPPGWVVANDNADPRAARPMNTIERWVAGYAAQRIGRTAPAVGTPERQGFDEANRRPALRRVQ